MLQRVIGLLLVVAGVIVANWLILRVWWQAIIRKTGWIFLFPVILPLVLFGPLYVIGYTTERLALPIGSSQKYALGMICLVLALVASFIGACKYRSSRRDPVRTNV